jgi:hypothetical protein
MKYPIPLDESKQMKPTPEQIEKWINEAVNLADSRIGKPGKWPPLGFPYKQEHYGFQNGYIAGRQKGWEEAQEREKILVEALERISAHGCCVMHNDSSCPGCEAKAALNPSRDSEKEW